MLVTLEVTLEDITTLSQFLCLYLEMVISQCVH